MAHETVTIIKTTQGTSLYEASATNAEIAADGNEVFFGDATADKSNKDHYGSFNHLEIVNDDALAVDIDLDGLTTRRRRLFGKHTIVITPEQGIFFDTVKLINTDSGIAVVAANIKLLARIVR